MTTLIPKPQIISSTGSANLDLKPALRLVVLLPSLDADLTPMAHRVWEIASATGARVQFLSLCSEPSQQASLKRRLVTMSAMLRDEGIPAEVEVMPGRDWVEAVRSRRQPGDMLVCLAGQSSGLLQRPLSQILRSNLDAPVTILTGLETALGVNPKWDKRFTAWAGLIGIVLVFSLLQAAILLRVQEGIGVWMLVSIAAEYWLISIFNRRFGWG